MTELMRKNVQPLFRSTSYDSHAGLLIQRGLVKWESENKETKNKLLSDITSVKPSQLYELALNRWIRKTSAAEETSFISLAAKIEGRLMSGHALGGALETGAITHHSYGMPLIPGSSIKGAVRNYVEHLYSEKDESGKLIIPDKYKQTLVALFGTDKDAENPDAGYLIWHDAWWLPELRNGNFHTSKDNTPFVEDIVTVHHQKYYSGGEGAYEEATGMESPIPNAQLAVQGQFYFVIEGAPQWVSYAKKLLEQTIAYNGLGAKGSSGYGYFIQDEQLNKELERLIETLNFTPTLSADNPYNEAEKSISALTDRELENAFSKDRTKFFANLEFDHKNEEDAKAFVKIALTYHEKVIQSWKGNNDKNKKRAYKFVIDHR